MPILIDGYNLMFAAGWMPRGTGPGALQRARRGLLNYLADHLPADEVRETMVVFDAKHAPPAVEHEFEYRGLRVRFAHDQEEADDLIELLIRQHSTPRQLQVITSDLRLRIAAQRRRAKAVKSEDWLDQLERRPMTPVPPAPRGEPSAQPFRHVPALERDEVWEWLNEFGFTGNATVEAAPTEPGAAIVPDESTESEVRHAETKTNETPQRTGPEGRDASGWGPFPPGYGEDLLSDGNDT
jgi:uncharacterized protein